MNAFGCTPAAYRKNPTPIPIQCRKYLGVYKASETANGPIWPNHNCDLLCGTISSMIDTHPIVTAYTAGWAWKGGEKNYFFGSGVACDYAGEVPEGFELMNVRKVIISCFLIHHLTI